MNLLHRYYPESEFGGFSDCDGTVSFYGRLNAILSPDMTVVDVGCGRGEALIDDPVAWRRDLRNLKTKCASVVGIDVDPVGASNPGIDEFRLISDQMKWPIEDEFADLVISDFVLEHVDDPSSFFLETRRILKPGGIFVARTTNRLGYVGIIASLIPNRWHAHVVGRAQRSRREMDVFPTQYRVNTNRALRRMLERHAFDGVVYGYEAEPSYLEFSRLVYGFGVMLHKVMPPGLRSTLFIFARKS